MIRRNTNRHKGGAHRCSASGHTRTKGDGHEISAWHRPRGPIAPTGEPSGGSLSTVSRADCRVRAVGGGRRGHRYGGGEPFKGTVTAVETGETAFPDLSLDRNGTGTATYLGNYTEHVTMQILIPTLNSTGAATFTAANGDTMTATIAGQATRTSPTTLSIVEHYTITGGTGRFAEATGSFDLASTLDQTTGASSGTLSGAIDL